MNRFPLLRRQDQLPLAALTAAAIVAMVVWYGARGGWRGELIELDRATPLDYSFLVDVNNAQWPELAQLPGLGEVLARRIADSRAAEGPFRTAEDLLRVDGIGLRRLAGFKRHLAPLPDDAQVAAGR